MYLLNTHKLFYILKAKLYPLLSFTFISNPIPFYSKTLFNSILPIFFLKPTQLRFLSLIPRISVINISPLVKSNGQFLIHYPLI